MDELDELDDDDDEEPELTELLELVAGLELLDDELLNDELLDEELLLFDDELLLFCTIELSDDGELEELVRGLDDDALLLELDSDELDELLRSINSEELLLLFELEELSKARELLDELFSGLDELLLEILVEELVPPSSKGRNQLNQVFDFDLAMGLGARVLEVQPIS